MTAGGTLRKTEYDAVIVGGGPGGYTAALYLARSGFSTLVVEKLSEGGQMSTTDAVDNYPGYDETIDGFTLGERMRRGAERFGAETLFAEVTALELQGTPKRVETTEGPIRARTVFVATGAKPRELGLNEEQALIGRGVAYCATCDGMRYKGKTVAVVGGGNSAAADALVLARICAKVYLIHRRDKLKAVQAYARPLADSNVQQILNSRVESIHAPEGRVTGVTLTDTRTGAQSRLACDALFVAIGRSPETSLVAGQLDLDDNGYIVADESTRTSIEGVFAVGDVRSKPLRQIVTATADGAVAAFYAEEFLMRG